MPSSSSNCKRSHVRPVKTPVSRQSTDYGSLPTMPRDARRPAILQGTLDLLILRTLLFGPLHGHGITKHIKSTSEDVLQVEHGSLYPALYRLEKNGCITSRWEQAANGREMRLYRLTAKGRKQLTAEESKWNQLVRAMARMLKPV
jgi:PadR family transcriptional regulator PadR